MMLAVAGICIAPVGAQQQAPAQNPQQNPQNPPSGQQPAPTPNSDPSKSSGPSQPSQNNDQNKSNPNGTPETQNGTSNDRLFFALPNFLTLENAANVPPLTAGQKFKVVARSAFDKIEFPWYAAQAGLGQAEDSERGYGQGAQGYAKRYGAAFGDGTIENFMTSAVLPSVLRQDPRFFQESDGGFWHRTKYAISRIFVTRTDSGGEQFNFSEIFGSALAAGISTYTYHPHADQTLPNTASVWGTQVGYDTITYVVKEWWPDIRKKMHKQKADVDVDAGVR